MLANTFEIRLEQLRRLLRRRKLDGIIVSQPENRRYLSGYSATDHGIQESSGVLLVPARGNPYLLTDSRFQIQAEEEAEGFQVELYPKGLLALLGKLLPSLGVKRLGFESHYTLHLTASSMGTKLGGAGVELVPLSGLIEKMRVIKSEGEIESLRQSVLLNEKVFQQILPQIVPGVTEIELVLELERTMRHLGAERPSFDTIVASGENSAKPHAVPGNKCLAAGAVVLIDMGLCLKGYCSDMSRTLVAGTGAGNEVFRERLQVVRRAQLAGQLAIREGALCCEVDRAARKVIEAAGYGPFFGHALGHGVGLNVHEGPRLSSRSRQKLRNGMIVTVEPGIYIPGWGGIRLENMVVVRPDGHELLGEDTTGLDV